MSEWTLLSGALLDTLSFALYVTAARRVLKTLPADRGQSSEAFALFWFGVGLVNLLQAALVAAALLGHATLALAYAVWNTRIVLALTSFAGLVYYLAYVYGGSTRPRVPIILFYAGVLLLMQVWLALSVPVGVDVVGWRVDLVFANPTRTPLYAAVVLLFFLPPLLASAAYARTLRVATDANQRRRIRLVSAGLAGYFLGMTLGYMNSSWPWWGLVENVIGLAAGALVIHAMRGGASTRGRGERDAAIDARIRQLV